MDGDGQVCSVPREWTDLVAPHPEVVIGEGRSLFRVQDLIDLARLVGGLVGERSLEASDEV